MQRPRPVTVSYTHLVKHDSVTDDIHLVSLEYSRPNAGHTLEFEGQKYVLRSIQMCIRDSHNIVIGKACVEHRKAIVMPGCKADILCPGRLNG